MNRIALAACLSACAAGCSGWRAERIPAEAPPIAGVENGEAAVPQAPPERRRAALFDADLGPDSVDVSAYPLERRRDYEAYARVCSRCHTLARSVNAPWVSRHWWDFYVGKMRQRGLNRGEELSDRDLRDALDFLEYDSQVRKVQRAAEFERLRGVLKRRFRRALDERVEELQKAPQVP